MSVLLIAWNFVRENRWPILLLLLWIMLSAAVFGGFGGDRVAPDDLIFYVRQQALYIVVFSAFLSSMVIRNERKSRRILLVLSKAVSRGEYLGSLLAGILLVAAVYSLAFGLCGAWLASRTGVSSRAAWGLAVVVLAASALSGALGLFFSTFLNPFVATAVTAGVLGVSTLPGVQTSSVWTPGAALLQDVLHFGFARGWTLNWEAVVVSLCEAAVFWALATLVFAYRDIAVAVE